MASLNGLMGVVALALAGCQQIGPSSIAMGRVNYNEIIQRTSKEQIFSNIIRVKEREPTSFLDVTQINAAVLVQGTLMGGSAGIGAAAGSSGGTLAGRTGSASIGIEYQESPTITYQPLIGPALISQISTPIESKSIVNLYNSDWSFASVITLPIDRLTPDFEDYGIAINALIALDDAGAITLATSPGQPASGIAISLHSNHPYHDASGNDKANIIILWNRLKQALHSGGSNSKKADSTDTSRDSTLLLVPSGARGQIPDAGQVNVNLINTRSALGILKAILEKPGALVRFIDDNSTLYNEITLSPWNANKSRQDCGAASFYTLLPDEEDELDNPSAGNDLNERLTKIIKQSQDSDEIPTKCLFTTSMKRDIYDDARLETRLATLRRFLLIRVSDISPSDTVAYVKYNMNDKWYYIDRRDEITQKNFLLLGQFLTIQAVATAPPPQTTIPAGPTR